MRKPGRQVDVHKASVFAIIINGMQIMLLLLLVGFVLFTDTWEESRSMLQLLVVVGAVAASWGAVIDIRQALVMDIRGQTIEGLETTNRMMDSLNHTLRSQRHDFLNHLQVVYSLLEMEEYTEATDYLEKVYGEIRSVSAVLRTKSTAVNALLQVKTAACRDQGVALHLTITSALEDIAMPAWEVCCILSNLMDNAIDAAQAAECPTVSLYISENIRFFRFAVRNNGATIPEHMAGRIFEAGISTKGEGRGMGLSIVEKTLETYGGSIEYETGDGETQFVANIPKAA